MNQEQLAAAFERAQREITMPQRQPINENIGSAVREHTTNDLEGTSLGRVDPVREPFNNAVEGLQEPDESPKTPELELRPPAPAPSPPSMGGSVQTQNPFPPMTLPDAQDVQESVDAIQEGWNEQEQGGHEKGIVEEPLEGDEPWRSQSAMQITGDELAGPYGDYELLDPDLPSPMTEAEVDGRVDEIKEMQAKYDATKDAREWAAGIKAMERQNEGPEQEQDL